MNNASLINQTSGCVEWYTPDNILHAARMVMGKIDLDPASSKIAQQRVRAQYFFTKEDDALSKPWKARSVFLNPPFGREHNPKWVMKMIAQYEMGNFDEGLILTFACTSEKWYQPLLRKPICFLTPRTNYLLPDGSLARGVTKGSSIAYFGSDISRFIHYFCKLGQVKL